MPRSTFPIVSPSSNSCFSSGWDPLLHGKISLRVGSLTFELKEGMQIGNTIPDFCIFSIILSVPQVIEQSLFLFPFQKRPLPGGRLIGPQDGEAGGVKAEGTLRADASHIHLRNKHHRRKGEFTRFTTKILTAKLFFFEF